MARLTTLKPRVQVLAPRLAAQPKPSAAQAYRIRGREGQRIRAMSLRASPLCVMCLAKGIVTVATESDHIIALTNGGADTLENRQGLCKPCHEAKTKLDVGLRADQPIFGPRWRLADRGADIKRKHAEHEAIRLPDLPMPRIQVTMVCGPPNGGKHPYVREHAGPIDVVIDLDQITPELSGLPVWQAGTEWLQRAMAERNRRLRALASDYTHTRAWFLINAPDPAEREQWARMLGAIIILLAPPLGECLRRIHAEPYHEGYTERMLDAAQDWWSVNENVRTHIGSDGFWTVVA